MRTEEDIESFLLECGYHFEQLGEEQWRVSDERNGMENILLYVTGTVLSIELRLTKVPENPTIELFQRLLELNASSIIHGAFGIENDHLVLIGALEVDQLDRNELQAMIDSISLAAGENYDELKTLIG